MTAIAGPPTSTPDRGGRLRSSGNALAGLLDAGLAALSTFLMGTAVVRLLPVQDLALYSGLFAGFVLCALLPTQLVYVPSQLAANTQTGSGGVRVAPDVAHDLRRHGWIVLAAAVLACLLGLPLAPQAGWSVYGFAAAGLFVLAVASPHQTHARSVLHVIGRHRAAAAVSGVTLALQAVLLVGPVLLVSAPGLQPAALGAVLLATGLGNAAGTGVALLILRREPRSAPTAASIGVRLGFLGAEAIAQIAGYVSILVVAAVLGTQAVAALEAARVVASPVQILVVGLLASLAPGVVRAVAAGDRPRFRRALRRTNSIVVVLGAAYAALLLLSGGLVSRLLGRAVDIDLAAARAGVTTVDSLGTTSGLAVLSKHRVLPLNAVSLGANALLLAALPVALSVFGAVGLPVAQGLGSAVKAIGLTAVARRAI